MKTFLSLLFTVFLINHLFTQVPGIEWQNNMGGNQNDYLKKIINTSDNGFLLVGRSYSGISGDKTESSLGETDIWVVKTDESGNIIWQNTIGGNAEDEASDVIQCLDGGFVVIGQTESGISGDKSEPLIGGLGDFDIWVVKLNASGAIEWENSIGSIGYEDAEEIVEAVDGGYIILATSDGVISGDKTIGSDGTEDYWVIKINSSGSIVWQKVIGGLDGDYAHGIDRTLDGGYIISGSSYSDIGADKTENNVGTEFDIWVLKLDVVGNIIWQNTINAEGNDYARALHSTADGGYILGSSTNSNDGFDKSENHFSGDNHNDYWVIKLNGDGTIAWENNIGGLQTDNLTEVLPTADGNFLVGGYSEWWGGDKTEYIGSYDYWILKLNNDGEIIWQDAIGAWVSDYLMTMVQAEDGGYLLGGYTNAGIGYDHAEANLGGFDYWIVKLFPDCVAEICNAVDDDCDGLVDDDITETITISAAGSTTFCQGGSVMLNAIYSGTSVQWKKNGTNIPGATSSSLIVTTKGTYTCETTSDCDSELSTGIFVTVNKNPSAIISAGGATTFCMGGSVVLTANSGVGLNYQWYNGPTPIAGATSINFLAIGAGTYKCRVTKTATGCNKLSNGIIVTVPCKDGLFNKNEINIFPNPNTGTFTISGAFEAYDHSTEIYNPIGQLIYSRIITSTEHIINETIELNNIASGIYTLRIIYGDSIEVKKFVVAN